MANSDQIAKGFGRAALGGAILLFLPQLIATPYLWLSRTYRLVDLNFLDLWIGAACISAGLVGVLVLPFGRIWRAMIAVAYIPIASGLLFFLSLMYVCGAFQECL